MEPLTSKSLTSQPDIFDRPYPSAGLSPYQQGSSLFSRGRVRYRRELVQPSATMPMAPRPERTQMRPAPNHMPQRRTTLWGQRNLPFSIQYPSKTESMVFYDPSIQAYIPEPFATMERDGSIVIPDADVLVKHAFDRTCGHLIHKAGDNLVIHNVEGTMKAYLWKPGQLDNLFSKGEVQKCVESLPALVDHISPQKQINLQENDVLHV